MCKRNIRYDGTTYIYSDGALVRHLTHALVYVLTTSAFSSLCRAVLDCRKAVVKTEKVNPKFKVRSISHTFAVRGRLSSILDNK